MYAYYGILRARRQRPQDSRRTGRERTAAEQRDWKERRPEQGIGKIPD